MPTPTNRVPVRVARGNIATLSASIDQLFEGEIVYAVDEGVLYAVDSGRLISVAGDGVTSINGQTGNVLIGIEQLVDVDLTSVANGDMLVYENGEWVNVPATAGGTVYSVDVTGDNAISSTGGPITNSGSISLELNPTGVTPGEYLYPKITVDAQGRITDVVPNASPDTGLDDLADVSAPTPGIGDGIVWDGINWVNSPDVGGGSDELGGLSDVDLDGDNTPLNGQALVYDALAGNWIPGTVDVELPPILLELDDLTDVDTSGFIGNDYVLEYRSSTQTWNPRPKSLNELNQIDEVWVGGALEYLPPTNGDVLTYNEYLDVWENRPPLSTGQISLSTYTTTPEESPLVGGQGLLPSRQAWLDLGFTLAGNGYDPEDDQQGPGFNFNYTNQIITLDQIGEETWLDGWQAFGGLAPNMQGFTLQTSIDNTINLGLYTTHINKPNNSIPGQMRYWSGKYNYISEATTTAQMEIAVVVDDIKSKQMRLWRTGILPNYVDEKGGNWTVIRKELVSELTTTRHFCIEHWFGQNGGLFTKLGNPSWGFSWVSGRVVQDTDDEFQHGLYFDGNKDYEDEEQLNALPRSVDGYGHRNWANTPTRGGWVSFTGPVETPYIPSINLDDLADVDTTNATADDIIKYDGTNWVLGQLPDVSNVPSVLDDLDDVDTAGAQSAQVLGYDGTEWGAVDLPTGVDLSQESLDSLGDVSTPSPEVGQLLQWNGSEWVAADAPESGAGSLDDLTDVNVSTPAPEDTQVLAYSQSDDEWQAANPRATAGAPTATTFPGLPGEMRYSDTHFYICIAPNTWKEVELQAIGGSPDPELGDIADGGDFLNGIEGTIDTILDGGNWTTGSTLDQEDVIMDGGYFGPALPELGDAIDGGNFLDGTSNGTRFLVDGGNFTTGAPGTDGGINIDGGQITPDLPEVGDAIDGGNFLDGTSNGTNFLLDGGNFTTGAPGTDGGIDIDGGIITPSLPGPDDIIDGGDFEDGTPGTNYRVDAGNFTTGQQAGPDVLLDGGFFSGNIPGPNDTIDGGDFNDGTPGTDFRVDAGNFTTGAAGGPDVLLDGGFFSGNIPGPDDIIDGGDFNDGTPGTDFRVDGGNWTTGAAGGPDIILDGGLFVPELPGPNDSIDGGNFDFGFSNGSDFYLDGGNFFTGQGGPGGIADGGFWSEIVLPGPDDTIDGGDFGQGGDTGTDFSIDGGNFTTGRNGTGGTIDGGDFTEDVVFEGVDGGDFTTGAPGADREVVDGGDFTLGYVIDDSPADGGDFTIPLNGTDEGTLDGGEFEI